jgi:hypothetical protein
MRVLGDSEAGRRQEGALMMAHSKHYIKLSHYIFRSLFAELFTKEPAYSQVAACAPIQFGLTFPRHGSASTGFYRVRLSRHAVSS